jgi:hypothetical protein
MKNSLAMILMLLIFQGQRMYNENLHINLHCTQEMKLLSLLWLYFFQQLVFAKFF